MMPSTKHCIRDTCFRGSLRVYDTIGEIRSIKFITSPIENADPRFCSPLSKVKESGKSEITGYFCKSQKTFYVFPEKEGYKIRMPKHASKFFYELGSAAFLSNLREIDVRGIDSSNIETCYQMFARVGQDGSNPNGVKIIGLDTWTEMKPLSCSMMFYHYNQFASRMEMNISMWNMEECVNFEMMFMEAGQRATSWYIGDISKWNIKSARVFSSFMFGISPIASFQLDLSSWNSEKISVTPQFFTSNNFFRVKEPDWQAMINRSLKSKKL